MNKIDNIILDLDGPLLDGKGKHFFCYKTILEKYGYKPIAIDEYWEMKRALVNRRHLLNMTGAGMIYDQFLDDWLSMIEIPEVLTLDKVQEGAIECLRSWKEQGIGLILATMRKNKITLDQQLEMTRLGQFLDVVLVCDRTDGGVGKADAVRKLMDSREFIEGSLWIGDTEVDWEAARSLGCPIVLVSNGLRNEQYLRALEDSLVTPSIASMLKVNLNANQEV